MFDLTRKTAIVTGAGQGIGREIARALAGQGAGVAVNDLYGERAEDAAKEITTAGGRAIGVAADVTDYDAVREMVAQAERELGPVDILVNNAGLPVGGDFVMKYFHET